jgi:hypothetical protein
MIDVRGSSFRTINLLSKIAATCIWQEALHFKEGKGKCTLVLFKDQTTAGKGSVTETSGFLLLRVVW